MNKTSSASRRIIIVSNRLPFTVSKSDGQLAFTDSVGGLATGLRSYLLSACGLSNGGIDYIWVGWPGSTVTDELKETVKSRSLIEHHSFPVFLSEEEVNKFYHGFCNKTLWPLFHYFPSHAEYNQEYWSHYIDVNKAFCDSLADLIKEDDIVWIHDYHLMMLPQMLRERFPSLSIGFFLHIPFPNFELFRLLPQHWRRELLKGLLGADLIGFHTFDYMQDFLRCVLRILGHESSMGRLLIGERLVQVETFPMGIDFKKFNDGAANVEVQNERIELKKPLGEIKIVLSIDRLDYSKGILNRLLGFETFLMTNPQWREKVTLLVILVPSRIGVDHYEAMKKNIEELVGNINGKFGTTGWTPIIYQYKALPFSTVVAMYTMSQVALITPLRDGMNLIAKEYVASRKDQMGVLILSEMAGAAKELGESIIINPNNREEIAESLKEALEMPEDEQRRRNQIMQQRLKRYDVHRWAKDFLGELAGIRQTDEVFFGKLLDPNTMLNLIERYNNAKKRLLLLDYDGTLIGFSKRPLQAKPSEELRRMLYDLCEDSLNDIVIISGRKKDNLEEWFGSLPISMIAEHGAWIKHPNADWTMIKHLLNDWKPKLIPLFEMYSDRVPGSFIEEKEYSIAWHYRMADHEHARLAAQELTDDLIAFTANIDVQVLQGSKVVEIRNGGVNKGTASLHLLAKSEYDFILAIGDDWTDEDMFSVLPADAFSFHVGPNRSHARFVVRNPREVIHLLKDLSTPIPFYNAILPLNVRDDNLA